MILQKEIRGIAAALVVPKSTIDKDWVIGHVLFAIFSHEILSKNLVFKGGTCLRKCYFDNYRFSEDLDFTVTNTDFLVKEEYILKMLLSAEKKSGIRFHLEDFSDMLFNDNLVGYKCTIKYWGADHPKNQAIPPPNLWHTYIKMEIITHEKICSAIEKRKLNHIFSDNETMLISIPCYSLAEMVSEKLRAILQRKYTAPRDYYDLWYILVKSGYVADWKKIKEAFLIKRELKNIEFSGPDDFFSEKHIFTLKSHWIPSLGHHINNADLPEPDLVLTDLKTIIKANI